MTLERLPNLSSLSSHRHKASNGAGFSSDDNVTIPAKENISSPLSSLFEPSKIKGSDDSDGSDDIFGSSTKNVIGMCPPKEIIEF